MVAGFIYLLGGADLLVRGAVAFARRMRVPPVVVALSLVAVGTSLPELVVSVSASTSGYPALVFGNVVGSNIANVLLVGGAAAVIFPLRTKDESVRRSASAMLAVSVLFAALCLLGGGISTLDGAILLAGLAVVFLITSRATVKAHLGAEAATPLDWVLGLPTKAPTIAFFVLLGLVALPLGADFLVDAAVEIADRIGVSEAVIGLSIVAVGTSLPEVATTVVAALQRRTGMAVGTIVGSNTVNLLGIMGLAAVVSPGAVPVTGRFLALDVPMMVGTSLLLVGYTWAKRPIRRPEGVLLTAAYVAYLVALYLAV